MILWEPSLAETTTGLGKEKLLENDVKYAPASIMASMSPAFNSGNLQFLYKRSSGEHNGPVT